MLLKTDGVVLKNSKFGEGDLMLTLFTKKVGKLQAVSKGAKGKKARLSPGIQLFSYGEFVLYKGRELYQVSQVDTKDAFYKLREDVEKLSNASYILELTNAVITEGQTNNRLFNELVKCLHILANMKSDYETIIKAYELKLLSYSGFRPELDHCVNCGATNFENPRFSFKEGGILCINCLNEDNNCINISPTAVKVMQFLIDNDLTNISKLKIKPQVQKELNRLIKSYISTYIDKTYFKSLDFLNSLKAIKY